MKNTVDRINKSITQSSIIYVNLFKFAINLNKKFKLILLNLAQNTLNGFICHKTTDDNKIIYWTILFITSRANIKNMNKL